MKYVNKITTVLTIVAILIASLFVPRDYQMLFILFGFALLSLIEGVLVMKFHCVKLITGIDTPKDMDIDKYAKYGGILLFTLAGFLLLATLLFFIDKTLFRSKYMALLAIPMMIMIVYCTCKMTKK